MHAEERQRECSQRHSEVQAGRLSGRFRLRAYRTVQTRPVSSRSATGFSQTSIPVPSAAAQTAPYGVKERTSFCLVFRSLNRTSSHWMFSMGYRRAISTQGNTNFQKRIFWQTTSGSLPAGLKQNFRRQQLLLGSEVSTFTTRYSFQIRSFEIERWRLGRDRLCGIRLKSIFVRFHNQIYRCKGIVTTLTRLVCEIQKEMTPWRSFEVSWRIMSRSIGGRAL